MSTVEFLGEEFAVAERVSALAFMRFAKLARAGVDADDIEGQAAMHDMLEQCIAPSDWYRFQTLADRERADGAQLLDLIQRVFAVLAARPTERPSSSSDGPQIIEPNFTEDSSSPATGPDRVIAKFNDQGRPDLALLVRRRQEESLSA